MGIILTILLIITSIVVAMLFFVAPFVASIFIYRSIICRTSKDKWARKVPEIKDVNILKMYEIGQEFFKENIDCVNEEHIINDGYNLYGQYFDFKKDKTVIIVQGRTESLLYSYYYAIPYKAAGFNVLVIDPRAHGLSDGRFNNVGIKEYRDLLAWSEMVHTKYNCNTIIYHGICIGAACSILAITNVKCKEYVKGIVTDGMYTHFFETLKNHIKAENKPWFPCIYMIWLYMLLFQHVNIHRSGPYRAILKLNKPILFLYSKEDKFSLPKKGQWLYDHCNAEKEIVWFEHGAHSQVRINNETLYDEAIKNFTDKYI